MPMPVVPPTALDLFDEQTKQEQIGVYLQDQIDYGKWVFTIGARYDWLETKTQNLLGAEGESVQTDEKLTGRVGASYRFDNGLAPYASYSTSFAPTIGANPDSDPFKPTTGSQKELGLRYTPEGIPDQQLSVWGQYDVASGPMQGLGVGLGVRFLDSSHADDGNLRGMTAQIAAKNIFDERDVTCVNLNCYREEGGNVVGSLSFRF